MLIGVCPPAFAWDNPNKTAAHFQTVPADRPSQLTLECRRVKSINGGDIAYDLGKRVILIKADSYTARRFADDVRQGRRSASASVTLTPERKSPFNDVYKAK